MQHHNVNADVLPARRGLARQDSKVLALASLGGALEFYDFMIFALMAPILSQLFFPASLGDGWALFYTYAIFATGYFMRPVGGLVMAHLGDRLGRKRMFTWSLLLMALPTLAMGLLPTYAQMGMLAPVLLLLCRMVQAVAIGGEVPAAWTYVSEQVPVNQVGLANGLLTAGLSVGILLGSLSVLALQAAFSTEVVNAGAWRLPFVLGGVLGLLAVWMRKHLQETPIFMAIKQRRLLYQGLPLAEVWRSHKMLLLIGMGINWFLLASVAVVLLAMPKLLQQQLGMTALQATTWQVCGIALQATGCIGFGYLADKRGISCSAWIGAGLMAVAATVFYFGMQTLPVGVLAGAYGVMAVCAGSGASLGKMVVRFPAPIRLSGMAATYNVSSALLGGLSLPLVAWLGQRFSWGAWLYLSLLCVMFALLGCWYAKHFEAACKSHS